MRINMGQQNWRTCGCVDSGHSWMGAFIFETQQVCEATTAVSNVDNMAAARMLTAIQGCLWPPRNVYTAYFILDDTDQRDGLNIEYLERPFPVHSCLCGWSCLIYFLIGKLSYSPSSEPSRTVFFLDVMYTTDPHHPVPLHLIYSSMGLKQLDSVTRSDLGYFSFCVWEFFFLFCNVNKMLVQ